MFLINENLKSYFPFNLNPTDDRARTKFSFPMTLSDESASFLYIIYIFCSTLHTMSKRCKKYMFHNDIIDDVYYFESIELATKCQPKFVNLAFIY